mmetsp:Transcript_625/g.1056  ORF Transcript_625/g.1056 Transcript_625/m.1056 type:complete len:93 (+) Transcript_625:143-421(+)
MSLTSIINIANHINKYTVVQGLPTAFNGQDVFDTHITKSYSGGSGSTAYANGNYNLICSSYVMIHSGEITDITAAPTALIITEMAFLCYAFW